MMLYESPNNANMWLSDPDTHPVVSQILRIYHAEKHSLNQNRVAAPAASNSTESSASNSSSSSESGIHRRHIGLPSRTSSSTSINSSVFSVRSDQPQAQYSSMPSNIFPPVSVTVRNPGSTGIANDQLLNCTGWVSTNSPSSPTLLHRNIPNSSPLPTSQINASPSSPNPVPIMRLNAEEPMSHSGSPVRSSAGARGVSDVPNGVTHEFTMTIVPPTIEGQPPMIPMSMEQYPQTTLPNTGNNDIEMDDSATDSQDMDTQWNYVLQSLLIKWLDTVNQKTSVVIASHDGSVLMVRSICKLSGRGKCDS